MTQLKNSLKENNILELLNEVAQEKCWIEATWETSLHSFLHSRVQRRSFGIFTVFVEARAVSSGLSEWAFHWDPYLHNQKLRYKLFA